MDPWWFTAAVAAEIAHFTCTFALQRLALRTRAWFPVITSQLAGNAITLIVPGGAAVGAAVQFRMLAASGRDTNSTVGGLAAFSLLGVGGLLALPAFTLPVILLGAPTSRLTSGTSDERGTLGVRGDVLLGVALQASLVAERFASGAGDAEGRVSVSELVGAAQISDDAINGNFGLCSTGRSS